MSRSLVPIQRMAGDSGKAADRRPGVEAEVDGKHGRESARGSFSRGGGGDGAVAGSSLRSEWVTSVSGVDEEPCRCTFGGCDVA